MGSKIALPMYTPELQQDIQNRLVRIEGQVRG